MIAANVALERPAGVTWHEVATAAELARACEERVSRLRRPADGGSGRGLQARGTRAGEDQEGGPRSPELELEPTADVARRPRRGAAARSDARRRSPPSTARTRSSRRARSCVAKGLDAIVVNDISRCGHRLRGRGQRGHDPHRPAASATSRAQPRRRSPRRFSTPSRPCAPGRLRHSSRLAGPKVSGSMEQRIRPLPARLRVAGARRSRRGDRAAEQGAQPGARQGLDPRGARPSAVSRPALRERGARVSGDRLERARPTTTRCSAWAARCSCSAATARPASRSRWPARWRPSARTTGATATARGAPPAASDAADAAPACDYRHVRRCYSRRHSFRAGARAAVAVQRVGARPLFLRNSRWGSLQTQEVEK